MCASPEGKCTLRDALEQNNAMPGPQGQWGRIKLPAGDYVLTLGEIAVTTTVSIQGAGPLNTRIDGNRVRAFRVQGGGIFIPTAETHLNMYRVHMVKCSSDWVGGAIFNSGDLDLANSVIAGNQDLNPRFIAPSTSNRIAVTVQRPNLV